MQPDSDYCTDCTSLGNQHEYEYFQMHLSGEDIRVAQAQAKYLQSDITQASIYDSFPLQNAQTPPNISKN